MSGAYPPAFMVAPFSISVSISGKTWYLCTVVEVPYPHGMVRTSLSNMFKVVDIIHKLWTSWTLTYTVTIAHDSPDFGNLMESSINGIATLGVLLQWSILHDTHMEWSTHHISLSNFFKVVDIIPKLWTSRWRLRYPISTAHVSPDLGNLIKSCCVDGSATLDALLPCLRLHAHMEWFTRLCQTHIKWLTYIIFFVQADGTSVHHSTC